MTEAHEDADPTKHMTALLVSQAEIASKQGSRCWAPQMMEVATITVIFKVCKWCKQMFIHPPNASLKVGIEKPNLMYTICSK